MGRSPGERRRGRAAPRKEELGYRVDLVQTDEVSRLGRPQPGRVDAILEDWGHPDQEKLYIDEKKTIVRGGDLGVTGHIGWYVPKYWADENPDVTDWKNLNKYADELRTAESGGKGQLMDGSPSYVTNDVALVKNLNLDCQGGLRRLRGGPDHPDPAVRQGEEAFLSYWYQPQWLFNEVPMVEVKLPSTRTSARPATRRTSTAPTRRRRCRSPQRRLRRARR